MKAQFRLQLLYVLQAVGSEPRLEAAAQRSFPKFPREVSAQSSLIPFPCLGRAGDYWTKKYAIWRDFFGVIVNILEGKFTRASGSGPFSRRDCANILGDL